MKVIGPPWPSKTVLQSALTPLEGPTLHWGIQKLNGLQQLQQLQAASLPCPNFTTSIPEPPYRASRPTATNLWVGRNLKHSKGRDIVTPNHRSFSQRDYWVQWIPSVAEWRQHIAYGRAIRRGYKQLTGTQRSDLPIRSRRNGWTINYDCQLAAPPNMRQLAIAAAGCCGYDLCAVDIIVGADGNCYVLECNSGPSLRDPNTLAAYVKAITEHYQH